MNNWHIDKKYFEHSIQKGYYLLNNNLSSERKRELKREIRVFKKYLKGNFDFYEGYDIIYSNITEEQKNKALKKIRKHYLLFNNTIFNYFEELHKANILTERDGNTKTLLNIDWQYDLTMRNYQVNSPFLFNYLKKQHNILVEVNDDIKYSSYCYYSLINDSQLIIINSKQNCYNFNHELEHAIENNLNYNSNNYFQELGAINFEMLFLDVLYDVNGYICDGDFEERVFDMCWYLDDLVKYFNLIKILAQRNFKVSLAEFIQIVKDTMDLTAEEVPYFTVSEIIGEGYDVSLTYLFSYLKAIKIRRMHSLNKSDNFELLRPYLLTNKYDFNDLNDFKIYDDYINEMAKRTRHK